MTKKRTPLPPVPRIELADVLLPKSEPNALALLTADGAHGWLYDPPQIADAARRWRCGSLSDAQYACTKKGGTPYQISRVERIGIVPHRDNLVHYFAVDLDAHPDKPDTTVFREPLIRFFGAPPVVWTSKSGKGYRLIYVLSEPMPVDAFVVWLKAWGFNREGRPEVFPKTDKLTMFYLPNKPNAQGGDKYLSGTWDKAVVSLPDAPPCQLTNAALDFLMGFVGDGTSGHNALYATAVELGEKRVDRTTAEALLRRAALLNGKTDDEEITKAIQDGYTRGLEKAPSIVAGDATIHQALIHILTAPCHSATERNQRIAQAVVSWLHERGSLFHTANQDFSGVMYFDSHRKLLLRVQGDAFLGWLSDSLGLNRADKIFSYIKAAVETEGLSARATRIEPAQYWFSTTTATYLSNGPGSVVRIAAEGVEVVDNGCDGVLFPADAVLEPWTYGAASNPFETCRLFRDMSAAAPHGKLLVALWVCSLPTYQPTKPPLCITGPIGGGKTRQPRGIAELWGLPQRVASVAKSGDRDFWVAVDAGGLAIFDNCDTRIDWLADALAAAATGGTLECRELYHTKKLASLKARASIAVTSANPTFAADAGLADRLIVVRLNRRTGETSESELSADISLHRSVGLSWIANILSTALADHDSIPSGLNHRHPDFAAMAVKIGRAMGREADAVAALRAAEADKSRFTIENDPILSVLAERLSRGPFTGSAEQLRIELCRTDPGLGGKLSSRGLGKRLGASWSHLESVFKAERATDSHAETLRYSFPTFAGYAGYKTPFPVNSLRSFSRKTLVKSGTSEPAQPANLPSVPRKRGAR